MSSVLYLLYNIRKIVSLYTVLKRSMLTLGLVKIVLAFWMWKNSKRLYLFSFIKLKFLWDIKCFIWICLKTNKLKFWIIQSSWTEVWSLGRLFNADWKRHIKCIKICANYYIILIYYLQIMELVLYKPTSIPVAKYWIIIL